MHGEPTGSGALGVGHLGRQDEPYGRDCRSTGLQPTGSVAVLAPENAHHSAEWVELDVLGLVSQPNTHQITPWWAPWYASPLEEGPGAQSLAVCSQRGCWNPFSEVSILAATYDMVLRSVTKTEHQVGFVSTWSGGCSNE